MQKCYDRILITYFLHSTLLLQGNANSRVGYCTVKVFKKLIRSEVSRLRDTGFPFILYSYMRPLLKAAMAIQYDRCLLRPFNCYY